jgi:integrase
VPIRFRTGLGRQPLHDAQAASATGVLCAVLKTNAVVGNHQMAMGRTWTPPAAKKTKTILRYKEPKSGRGRTIALSATLVAELRAHRGRQAEELLRFAKRLSGDDFVVTRADGSPLRPHSLGQEWVRFLAHNGALPRIRFHDLRHAHATHLLSSGVHPKVASERLGHSKVGITLDLYSHVLPNMQSDAAALVDDALRAGLNKRQNKG